MTFSETSALDLDQASLARSCFDNFALALRMCQGLQMRGRSLTEAKSKAKGHGFEKGLYYKIKFG